MAADCIAETAGSTPFVQLASVVKQFSAELNNVERPVSAATLAALKESMRHKFDPSAWQAAEPIIAAYAELDSNRYAESSDPAVSTAVPVGISILRAYNLLGERLTQLRAWEEDSDKARQRVISEQNHLHQAWTSSTSPDGTTLMSHAHSGPPFSPFAQKKPQRSSTSLRQRARLHRLEEDLYQLQRQKCEYRLQIAKCKSAILCSEITEVDAGVQILSEFSQCIPAEAMEDSAIQESDTGDKATRTNTSSSGQPAPVVFDPHFEHQASTRQQQLLAQYLTQTVGPTSSAQVFEAEITRASDALLNSSASVARDEEDRTRFLLSHGHLVHCDVSAPQSVSAHLLAWKVRDACRQRGSSTYCFLGKSVIDTIVRISALQDRDAALEQSNTFLQQMCMQTVSTSNRDEQPRTCAEFNYYMFQPYPARPTQHDEITQCVPDPNKSPAEKRQDARATLDKLCQSLVQAANKPLEALFNVNRLTILVQCLAQSLSCLDRLRNDIQTVEHEIAVTQLRPSDRAARFRRLISDVLEGNVPFLGFAAQYLGRAKPLLDPASPFAGEGSSGRSLLNVVFPNIDAQNQELFDILLGNCEVGESRKQLDRWRAVLTQWRTNPTQRVSCCDLGLGGSLKLSLGVATILRVAASLACCIDRQFTISAVMSTKASVVNRLRLNLARDQQTTTHFGPQGTKSATGNHATILNQNSLRTAIQILLGGLVQNFLFKDASNEDLLLHVIETKFPTTLVQDTALACQKDWMKVVAPHPAVFGFLPKSGGRLNPCLPALRLLKGVANSWTPNNLLECVVGTLQSIFHESQRFACVFSADDVFPLVVFLLAHVECDSISRRLQCAAEAIDVFVEQSLQEAVDELVPYYGALDDENTVSELKYYSTAMQVALQYLCMIPTDEGVGDSFLCTSFQHAIHVDKCLRVLPPCAWPHACEQSDQSQSADVAELTLFQKIRNAAKDERRRIRRRGSAAHGAPSNGHADQKVDYQVQTTVQSSVRAGIDGVPLIGPIRSEGDDHDEWAFDINLTTDNCQCVDMSHHQKVTMRGGQSVVQAWRLAITTICT